MVHALFSGLIVDERERPVNVVQVGDQTFYVVDDDGFLRHIESGQVDRQVLEQLRQQVEGHENLISEGAMKMLGQEDIFTKAAIEAQLKNVEAQFEALMRQGIPGEVRAWLGMLGFRIMINVHGDVVKVEQPEASE